jgi:hypothetical protein
MPTPDNGSPGTRTADPPRSLAQRRDDVLHMLAAERHLWIASAADGLPHLIPLAFAWDGTTIIFVTRRTSRTVQNLRKSARARAALGSSRDVVIIEGPVSFTEPADADAGLRAVLATLPLDPEKVPGAVGVHLMPQRILAWRGLNEIGSRTIMAGGQWLG